MNTDPIADYLTRIRNASSVGHRFVGIPYSSLKERITEVLQEQGYIRAFRVEGEGYKRVIKIALKYDKETKQPVITTLTRASKPGKRLYAGVATMPRVKNGLGVAVLSTPKGVMTAKQAQSLNIGGEVLFYIF